ncbi:MAG: MerR family transcriptional regulator [bacterium]|nr:MerR family transcriptional regulator [bacterium]
MGGAEAGGQPSTIAVPARASPGARSGQRTSPRVPLTITEVALELGLTHRAIRFYEDQGLIGSARNRRNARVFDEDAASRLRVIAELRTLGLQLSEIAKLLDDAQAKMAIRERLTERLALITAQCAAIKAYLDNTSNA